MPSALAEWRVLSGGIDEVDLWELPGVHTFYGFPGLPRTSPDVPVGEVQAALAEALRRGLVVLYDESVGEELDPAQAAAVVADLTYFHRETFPRLVSVSITDAGREALEGAWDRYRADVAS